MGNYRTSDPRPHGMRDMADGILKNGQTFADSLLTAPAPCGVLNGVHASLWVRHQAENQPAGVANAGDVVDAAVGIVRGLPTRGSPIGAGIGERDLVIIPQFLADRVVS